MSKTDDDFLLALPNGLLLTKGEGVIQLIFIADIPLVISNVDERCWFSVSPVNGLPLTKGEGVILFFFFFFFFVADPHCVSNFEERWFSVTPTMGLPLTKGEGSEVILFLFCFFLADPLNSGIVDDNSCTILNLENSLLENILPENILLQNILLTFCWKTFCWKTIFANSLLHYKNLIRLNTVSSQYTRLLCENR